MEIEALTGLQEFEFIKNITFFTGENGSGKSTLLEALSVAAGLNPEGGILNYHFHTYDDYSCLGNAVKLIRGINRPKWNYRLIIDLLPHYHHIPSYRFTKISKTLNVKLVKGMMVLHFSRQP